MRYRYFILLVLLLLCSLLPAQVNGNLMSMGGRNVLKTWGTHYERGFAHGYLLGDEVKTVFQDFFFTMLAFSDPVVYNNLWSFYMEHFTIDQRMLQEANGLIAGMTAAGVNTFHNGLNRDLNSEDILLLNAVTDLNYLNRNDALKLGCASLSSWGSVTSADPVLSGNAVITRFLDWSPNSALIANPLLIVHFPSEQDEQKWISFTFPGMIGALSAINESGLAAFMNTSNDHSYSNISNLSPILFSIRKGVERLDVDGNETYTAEDLWYAIQNDEQLSGTLIQNLMEFPGYRHNSVIETKNGGTVRRIENQAGNLPTGHIAATNHFRLLSSGTCCTRYSNIQDSLYTNPVMTPKRQLQVLSGAAGMDDNLQSIQYIPSTGYILWSTAILNAPAFSQPGLVLSTSELFSNPSALEDDSIPGAVTSLKVWPNPVQRGESLNVSGKSTLSNLEIYNLKGQRLKSIEIKSKSGEISTAGLSTGIYLIKAKDLSGKSFSKRILVNN